MSSILTVRQSVLAISLAFGASAVTPCVFAADTDSEESTPQVLPEVRLQAERESVGEQRLDKRQIEAMNGIDGNITSLLRINPSVQFDNKQQASATQGELAPADISINGAKFYDNLYQMDGMSLNNDIGPGSNNPANLTTPPSASQGFAVDTSLLCDVTVLDSNIGAEYGRFKGGVVNANTCAPARKLAGQVSVESTRSAWMKYKLSDAQRESAANSATADLQPEFEKWTYRAALQGKVTENFSLIGSFIRKTSEIPLNGYGNGLQSASDANRKVQRRGSDNAFVRGFWSISPGVLADFSLMHAPSDGDYFIANAKNSTYHLKSGGNGLNLGLTHPIALLGNATAEHRLSWNRMDSSRDADATVWKGWRYSSNKNWGVKTGTGATGWSSNEGGYGDVDQEQESAQYQGKLKWESFALLGATHTFQAGLELGTQHSSYQRNTTYEQYTASVNTSTCNMVGGVDTQYCSLATPWNAASNVRGQYLSSRVIYYAGGYELSNKTRGAFLQDDIRAGNVRLRLGARYDSDDLSPKSSIAPRLSAFWDVAGKGTTQVEVGANRYYGRNFFDFYANSKRLALQTKAQTRTLSGGLLKDWAAPEMATNWTWYQLGDMKTPYTDEKMLGVSHLWGGVKWSAKRVLREGRDEIVQHLESAAHYYWDNIGSTDSKVWTLAAETARPLRWGGSSTQVQFAYDHTRTRSSHASYDDTLSNLAGELDDYIYYQGKFVRWIDRPANNYNRPWTARLLLSTDVPAYRLKVDNFFRVRGPETGMVTTGESLMFDGGVATVFKDITVGKSISWDMRVQYALPKTGPGEGFVNLGIENLTNRTNPLYQSATALVYEKGRQFTLELGYRF
ncbi:TonB-dependent receptor plug domain-containing protein [Janthinobacterium sp. BJB401]|uniref:TonB-dependent receptor plug domain-containing protein n=1 Tax=Janthinobacterium sp. BJB401 TaxID=2745934 RepID=UPI0015961BD5|nr:TonB-dependent receptor plug domain-containing protein [Janthinobacterium sp. BJB401]NVI81171.1 TonB-dependent receptor plug domain-containing protein [Janthinobacterium sp. BJB401]